MPTVLHRIRDRYDELTDAERTIASWLQNNPDQLAFKPAGFIARQCEVSESTVVRFARKLGYESYPQMQEEVQSAVREQLSLRQKLQRSVKSSTSLGAQQDAFQMDIQNLKESMQTVNPAALQQAVALLSHAGQVGVLGLRASYGVASHLAFSLGLVRPGVRPLAAQSDAILDQLLEFGPTDVVVAFSIARPARRTIEVVEYCARRAIPVIGMTDWDYAPLEGYCDPCLKVCTRGVFWESYTALVSLCNALLIGVGHTLADSAENRLKQLEEANFDPTTVKEDTP